MSIFDAFDRLFEWRKSFWSDFDDMFEDIKEMKEYKGKNYSISYHYETGMDTPKIEVKGDVDQETIDKFIKRTEEKLGTSLPKGKHPDIKLIESGEEE